MIVLRSSEMLLNFSCWLTKDGVGESSPIIPPSIRSLV
jgi:hypothetical protein